MPQISPRVVYNVLAGLQMAVCVGLDKPLAAFCVGLCYLWLAFSLGKASQPSHVGK
jgi:hypothetical protein